MRHLSDLAEVQPARRHHAVVDRHELGGDAHAVGLAGQSASRVVATPPSNEFSIGTTARSTSPSWTAITAPG